MSVVEDGDTTVSIAQLTRQTRKNFTRAIGSFNSEGSHPLKTTYQATLIDSLERFQLWAGNIGAAIDLRKEISLEDRLKDALEVKEQIYDLLCDLHEALEDLYSISIGERENRTKDAEILELEVGDGAVCFNSRSINEAQDISGIIIDCVSGLMKLSIFIRKATHRDRWSKALQVPKDRLDNQYGIRHVEQKFPKLNKPELEWLKIRLGCAITQRRQFIRYCREHCQKLSTEEAENYSTTATENVQMSKSKEIVSETGRVIRTHNGGFSTPALAVGQDSTKASTFQGPHLKAGQKEEDNGDLSLVSSVVSSLNIDDDDDDSERLQLPSLQYVSNGKPNFKCPYCSMMQHIGQEKEWKRHAFADLKPYTCCAEKGECDLVMFADRNSWFNHELKYHRHEWICLMCQSEPFRSLEEFRSHIEIKHKEVPVEQISDLVQVSQQQLNRIPATDCPFCDDFSQKIRSRPTKITGGVSDPDGILVDARQFRNHVASHMEQLALFAIGPYDVGSEEPPLVPFFASPFQTALQKGLDIARDAANAMETAGQSLVAGGDLQRLINDAKELSTFKSSETRTIAVLGDSGEGKSSLINSLLHFPDIAKTGDIGAACTSVVTEYRQKTTDHLAPITIEVEYLSMGEIEDLIKELVWNYRQMYLPHTEGDSISENEYATMQRESEQAWSSLEAGFSHQPSFNKAMLINDLSEAGLSIANSQLVQWAYKLDWPDSGEIGKWTSTADTADECCEKTSVFMEDRFWPFTKIIRVYLQADVLKTGIILADLPGLHDTNLARVKATQDYLLRCDHIFIVAKISRAITDQSLKSSLYSILSRHAELEWEESAGKSMKVAVVCTNSEDINVKAARQEFCGLNKSIPQGVMTKLDQDIKEAKAQGNKALKKQLKREQQLLLISARNTHVKEGLQRAYSSKVPNGGLEVFCVSNTTYGKYAIKGNVEMVQASGIPELRRFCYTMTAHAQLLEARHFLSSMLSSFLNSAELLATKPTESQQTTETELDESMFLAVNNGKTETLRAVSQSKSEFQDTFQELVLTLLDKQSEVWETLAKQNSASWNSWHWTQYNAWCRHDGYHYTEKRGKVNWNAELIWKMRMEMAFQWETLEEDIPTLFKDLLQSAKAPLLALQSEMREKCFSPLLVEGIDFRIQSLTYRCSLAEQNFAKEVKITRSKASEPNESSYIFAEMVPAYRSAANECGTGKAARQRNTVQGRITNGTLFPNISSAIKREIKAAAKTTFDSVRKSLESDFALIENDVMMALAAVPQQSGDREDVACEDEERLRGELAGAVRGLKRQHAEVLAIIANI